MATNQADANSGISQRARDLAKIVSTRQFAETGCGLSEATLVFAAEHIENSMQSEVRKAVAAIVLMVKNSAEDLRTGDSAYHAELCMELRQLAAELERDWLGETKLAI